MNKEAFIEGFVKKAVDLGYSDDAVVELFKLAMADPVASEVFNKEANLQAVQEMLTNPNKSAQFKQLINK